MLVDEQKPVAQPTDPKTRLPWLRLLLGSAVTALTLWFLSREVLWSDVWPALQSADSRFIILGVAAVLLVVVLKTWRWQLLFFPAATRPPLLPALWSLLFGQSINLLSPVRLGEVARVYYLYQETRTSRGQALGTLVVEKTLDSLTLVLTILAILPWVVLPQAISNPALTLGIMAAGLLVALYVLAYQSAWVVRLVGRVAAWLPDSAEKQVMRLATSSLDGLAALRDRDAAWKLVGASAAVGVAVLLAPWAMLAAFRLPYGVLAAALIHAGLTIGLALPAPAKLGVFEVSVYVMLNQIGVTDEAVKVSLAILFHIIAVVPLLALGGFAALRVRWSWRQIFRDPRWLERQSAPPRE